MKESLRLRPAEAGDAERVFVWVNDPATRAAGFFPERIPLSDHLAWFRAALENPERRLFLAESLEAGPVAFLRLDGSEGEATVSINVAPEARGLGYGKRGLELLREAARASGFMRLVAVIRDDNPASQKTFCASGYRFEASMLVGKVPAGRYVLELSPPPDAFGESTR